MSGQVKAFTGTKAIAGPWIGEFGWELFGWQGYLRAISKNYEQFIVICQPGHEFLYQDFASEFIEYEPTGTEKTMWQNKDSGITYKEVRNMAFDRRIEELILPNVVYNKQWLTLKPDAPKQEFIQYGKGPKIAGKVLLHARNTNKCLTGYKNYPYWTELIDKFYDEQGGLDVELYSIGTCQDALHLAGTTDLRGIPLDQLCQHISEAELVVGPSSGPIHLAALCGTEQVTWTGHARVPERHATEWNPFDVKVQIIYPGGNVWDKGQKWGPTPLNVFNTCKVMMS